MIEHACHERGARLGQQQEYQRRKPELPPRRNIARRMTSSSHQPPGHGRDADQHKQPNRENCQTQPEHQEHGSPPDSNGRTPTRRRARPVRGSRAQTPTSPAPNAAVLRSGGRTAESAVGPRSNTGATPDASGSGTAAIGPASRSRATLPRSRKRPGPATARPSGRSAGTTAQVARAEADRRAGANRPAIRWLNWANRPAIRWLAGASRPAVRRFEPNSCAQVQEESETERGEPLASIYPRRRAEQASKVETASFEKQKRGRMSSPPSSAWQAATQKIEVTPRFKSRRS